MNRRKYDIENLELHEKLWEKWQLEAVQFWAYQDDQEQNSQVDNTIFLRVA